MKQRLFQDRFLIEEIVFSQRVTGDAGIIGVPGRRNKGKGFCPPLITMSSGTWDTSQLDGSSGSDGHSD